MKESNNHISKIKQKQYQKQKKGRMTTAKRTTTGSIKYITEVTKRKEDYINVNNIAATTTTRTSTKKNQKKINDKNNNNNNNIKKNGRQIINTNNSKIKNNSIKITVRNKRI